MRGFVLNAVCAAGLLAAAPAAWAADAGQGEEVYATCAACHGEKGAGTETGPALAGIVGRKAAGVDGFRYSAAMKRSRHHLGCGVAEGVHRRSAGQGEGQPDAVRRGAGRQGGR